MVSQSKFSVTLPRVWICIAPLLGLLSPEGVVLNPEGFVLSPEGDVLNLEGFVLPHLWDYLPPEGQYWSCALNMMMQSSICRQANHRKHSKIGRFLYKYKLEKYIHNCA